MGCASRQGQCDRPWAVKPKSRLHLSRQKEDRTLGGAAFLHKGVFCLFLVEFCVDFFLQFLELPATAFVLKEIVGTNAARKPALD